jgi:hypothetical protein
MACPTDGTLIVIRTGFSEHVKCEVDIAVQITTNIPPAVAAFFGLLAVNFLILSATRGSPLTRKVWRRIGIIFAVVALVVFLVRPR